MHQYRLICSFSGSLYKIESDDVDTQFFHNFDIDHSVLLICLSVFSFRGPLFRLYTFHSDVASPTWVDMA